MQARFEINDAYFIDTEQGVLTVQVGPGYMAYAVCDAMGAKLGALKWYTTEKSDLTEIFSGNDLIMQPFSKKVILFDYPSYTLLPVALNEGDNSALLHLAGGDPQDHLLTEIVKQDISLNYSVPFAVLNQCIQYLPGAAYWHLQNIRITEALMDTVPAVIEVNFIDQDFSVVVVQNGKLLLAQHYHYKAPEDVLFYLLKIGEVYGLSQTTVQLNISGLIDADSRLYRLLYDYFLNIRLMKAGWTDEDTFNLPPHYFTTLKQAAICAL